MRFDLTLALAHRLQPPATAQTEFRIVPDGAELVRVIKVHINHALQIYRAGRAVVRL